MRTLAAPSRIEIEIRRSRFIAHAARVDNPQAAQAYLEAVADRTASHNCWAWKIGPAYRFNDDGEPASTAGKPIFAALEGKGVDHVMVVVTRHFGGIKLGAGGLARAYGGAAARVIDAARIVTIEPTLECVIEADFSLTGPVHAALEASGARKLDEQFLPNGIRIRAEVSEADWPGLRAAVRDATRGAASIRRSA
jgi:putative IMPACT (imprinted ancient) family translation regulator